MTIEPLEMKYKKAMEINNSLKNPKTPEEIWHKILTQENNSKQKQMREDIRAFVNALELPGYREDKFENGTIFKNLKRHVDE